MHNKPIALFSVIALTATAGLLIAGPLTPPGGAIASSYKTLTDVEPRIAISAANTPGNASNLFVITQPGSYYLTGNITGVAGKTAILINAHHVSLDLNGFRISGGLNGIDAIPPAPDGIVVFPHVFNGSITNCSNMGIKFDNTFEATLENLRVQACTSTGFRCHWRFEIHNCDASDCGIGFNLGDGGHISHCNAHDSITTGFSCGDNNLVESCNAFLGSGNGFANGSETTYRNCLASRNSGTGFTLVNSCTMDHCQAFESGSVGILAGSGSTIRDCEVAKGSTDGISVGNNCSVIGNTSYDNAQVSANGTGIRVGANDCVVQDNRVSANGNWGIYVSGTGNFISRNWSRGHLNTNLYVAAGNDSGPTSNAPGVGAANANAWTNFTR